MWRRQAMTRLAKRLTHGRRENLLRQAHIPWRPAGLAIGTLPLLILAEGMWPDHGRNDPSTALSTLLAVFAAATLAIFVSISLFQGSGRYVELTVSAMADDPEREDLLHMIVYGVVVALGQVIIYSLFPGSIWYSVAYTGLVALAVVLFLFGYVRTRLRLFTPRELAIYLKEQAKRHQRQAMAPAAKKRLAPGDRKAKSITAHQDRVLRRFCDLGFLAHSELTKGREGRIETAATAIECLFKLLVEQAWDRRYARKANVIVVARIPIRSKNDKLSDTEDWYAYIAGKEKVEEAPAIPLKLSQDVLALWLESAAKRVLLQLATDVTAFAPDQHQTKIISKKWKDGFEKWRDACLQSQQSYDKTQTQPLYRWCNDLFTGIGVTLLADETGKASQGRLVAFGESADVVGADGVAKPGQISKLLQHILTSAPMTQTEAEAAALLPIDSYAQPERKKLKERLDQLPLTHREVIAATTFAFNTLSEKPSRAAVAFYINPFDRLRARTMPRSERAGYLKGVARRRYVAQALGHRESCLFGEADAAAMRKAAENKLIEWRRLAKKGERPSFWS